MTTRRLPVVICLLFAAACGPNAKQKALSYTVTGLNAARDGFVIWDANHQQKIVDDATSLGEGQAALTAYRAKREAVLQAFTVAYSALAVAALDPSAAMLLEALNAAKEVYKLVKDLSGGAVAPPNP